MAEETAFAHEYLTVKELAALLRLKERKIYDLAASGAVPCSRATGKLLFPAAEIRNWIAGQNGPQSGAGQGGALRSVRASSPRPPIILGSHDPLLDWAIRESRCGLATYIDGSLDGVARFVRGEGSAAGLHVYDAASDDWNMRAASAAASGQNAVLIAFANRQRGFVSRPGERAPADFSELAGLCLVPRQPESGTELLFRHLLEKSGVAHEALKLASIARTEDDAVERVRRGEADLAFGLEAAARAYGLDFMPVIEERFALLVDRRAWFEPPLRTLSAFCTSAPFRARAKALGGYDVRDFGVVIWNA